MRIVRSSFPLLVFGLVFMAFLSPGRAATPMLTWAEQEVIEALLQQEFGTGVAKKLIIEDTTSIRRGDSYDKLAKDLREQARYRDAAFKEALEDFLKKNTNDTKIVFPSNTPARVELVSRVMLDEIFSAKHNAKPNGWDRFYQRFPGSAGVSSISRVGVDSKGMVAIIYLGTQSHYLAGRGGIRVLKREGKKWVYNYDDFGPQWVS